MAIKFGIAKQEENTIEEILDKAMANLQKFAGPIFKETLKHPSKTTITKDPAKALMMATEVRNQSALMEQEMTKDIPSTGEILLGGVAGAASGFLAGKNMTTSTGNPGGSGAGKAIGAVVGGFLGSSSYSKGREAGKAGQGALGAIMGISAEFKKNAQQKMAEDAVGTATQELGRLNNPGNDPALAAQNAAERERITAQLATDLVASGLAPDKAITTAANISAINAPNSKELQDPGLQAQRAIAEYHASGKTKSDKLKLKTTINAIVMGQGIKLGKMPANSNALLNQILGEGATAVAGQGASGGADGSRLTVEPLDANGAPIGPPVPVGKGQTGGGTAAPSPSSGGSGLASSASGSQSLPEGFGELPDDIRKGTVATLQVQDLASQAISMVESDPHLKSALSKKKGPVGSIFGTSEADVFANGMGIQVPGMGRVGEVGKHASGMSGLTPEEQAAVLKFNQLITPLAQAAGKMRDPGVLQGNEFKVAKDVTGALTLSPEQNLSLLQGLLAEAEQKKKLFGTALPKGGNTTKKGKSKEPGLIMFN